MSQGAGMDYRLKNNPLSKNVYFSFLRLLRNFFLPHWSKIQGFRIKEISKNKSGLQGLSKI